MPSALAYSAAVKQRFSRGSGSRYELPFTYLEPFRSPREVGAEDETGRFRPRGRGYFGNALPISAWSGASSSMSMPPPSPGRTRAARGRLSRPVSCRYSLLLHCKRSRPPSPDASSPPETRPGPPGRRGSRPRLLRRRPGPRSLRHRLTGLPASVGRLHRLGLHRVGNVHVDLRGHAHTRR